MNHLMQLKKNYQCLMALFDWATHNTSDPDMKARLIGVSHQMTTFEYYFGLKLTKLIFRHCDYLSKAMQAKNITAGECQTLAFHTRNTLKKLREDDSQGFDLFWKQVTDGAK